MKHLIVLLILPFTVACSNQWRDGDAHLTATELNEMLAEVGQAQSQSVGGATISEVLAMKDEGAAIYFADGPGPMGPVQSIVSLTSFDFLNLSEYLDRTMLSAARVFFFDGFAQEGRPAGLILGLQKQGASSFTYYAMKGSSTASDGYFESYLQTGATYDLQLRTFDVTDDELAQTIQLKAYEVDANGAEYYIGKFSTLVGFDP